MNLYHFLGDNELWFCAFWSGRVSPDFCCSDKYPRGEKTDLAHSFIGSQLFSLDFRGYNEAEHHGR